MKFHDVFNDYSWFKFLKKYQNFFLAFNNNLYELKINHILEK